MTLRAVPTLIADRGAALMLSMRVLIIGCGYVGLPLGAELVRQGHMVAGLRRTLINAEELTAVGIQPLAADITKHDQLNRLPADYDWVINCVSAGGGGAESYRATYLEGTRNLIEWLSRAQPQKFVYTSSTGVYGQNDGLPVDEGCPTEPESETGRILVATERLLLDAYQQLAFPAIPLRIAGIYGPGRGYWLKQFLSGEAKLEGDGGRWLNMIHRDDVVGGIIAALERGRPGEVYNLADDRPVTQLELFQWLAKKLGRPMPPAVAEAPSARKRGATNKQVLNRKLKSELGYRLKYPTFREGYAAEMIAAR
jgi:nucleoside-diphosphate-sugar epimerase